MLRVIYLANEKGRKVVGPSYISSTLRIPKSTAHKMLLKLAESGFGVYIPKKGFILNEIGVKEGLKALKKHRLIECLLEELGISYEHICVEATKIESFVSQELLRVIEERYRGRRFCPCGKEIPEVEL